MTRRERNERFGIASPEVSIPPEGEFVWSAFWGISTCRSSGFNGPNPITPRDIMDWSAVTGSVLRREECGIILAMDVAFREAVAAESEATSSRESR